MLRYGQRKFKVITDGEKNVAIRGSAPSLITGDKNALELDMLQMCPQIMHRIK